MSAENSDTRPTDIYDPETARAYLNYLLTLSIRREESFGPLSLAFIREQNLDALKILPEEQFSLIIATVQSLADEPKRFSMKAEMLERARGVLDRTRYSSPQIARQIEYDLKKTRAELEIYKNSMQAGGPSAPDCPQSLVIESEAPDYYLTVAQKRAGAYYQNKFGLSKQAKTAQHFAGSPRVFDPDNRDIQKEFSGACAPFMNSRTNAFHLMLPFDLKISRTPDDPLEAGIRAYYAKMGYSFPLAFERDKFCSYHDGSVLDIAMDDPHLIFVSASAVKEKEFPNHCFVGPEGAPPEFAYPITVLERTGTLGPYVQIPTNFKIWFDACRVSLLVQGAPDLYEYGLHGGSGLMTRTHASDKTKAYADSEKQLWSDGLSFNFANIHLLLDEKREMAHIPHNTPLFSLYPVVNRQQVRFENAEKHAR
ncbi:MAG: hypothetical protein G3M78_06075 [Candidatus Nitrohelix vancouverensis]|uniref:Uncharacterized protein n=1 Tax=Candidatus Nitrohelix vancouverensis TaxID=2705534 RepID=A0A7T0C1W2_9BACT|nr:MAG: hypothetical protein G3M78_06075 [Candidatus Nitrohelix vancouverensis]